MCGFQEPAQRECIVSRATLGLAPVDFSVAAGAEPHHTCFPPLSQHAGRKTLSRLHSVSATPHCVKQGTVPAQFRHQEKSGVACLRRGGLANTRPQRRLNRHENEAHAQHCQPQPKTRSIDLLAGLRSAARCRASQKTCDQTNDEKSEMPILQKTKTRVHIITGDHRNTRRTVIAHVV